MPLKSAKLVNYCLKAALAMAIVIAGPSLVRAESKVSVSENPYTYKLENGIVTAEINKHSADLVSLKYHGLELMGGGSGHPDGYWSHSPGRGMAVTNILTIDPRSNGGERAEVSVKGTYLGIRQPRTTPGDNSSTACDIEIRYALGRGDSGLYTYSIFTHPTNYPATGIGEARFGAKLNARVFDYMTIDENRRKLMPKPADWDQGTELNAKEARRLNTGIYKGQVEHKYDYSAIQFNIPAYGWSSTRQKIGLWFVNPTIEYLSGGATKVELTGHLDNNEGAAPTLLNYWRGSHYGGSVCAIGEGEHWSKVVGPFLIYCNAGETPDAMWKDALQKAALESKAWPYDWVRGADYPHRNERATVSGQIVLADPQAPGLQVSNILVGLAAPDYVPPRMNRMPSWFNPAGGGEDESATNHNAETAAPTNEPPRFQETTNRFSRWAGRGYFGPRIVDWQNDAQFYQFWVRADAHGNFSIPNVRPGTYTLHVIADGVLGEFTKTNISVSAGQKIDLSKLTWTPQRFGKQLWEVGIPNRSAEEFRNGDHYWQWGLYYEYTNDFPHDVNFVIGKSDLRKDWNYAEVPRSPQRGTTWTIQFSLTNSPYGKATLRMGIAGISARGGVQVSVNGKPVGGTGPMTDTATIRRDGIRGYWSERDVAFDAALMHPGTNSAQLTIAAGNQSNGVLYDYLRLELDEAAKFEPALANPAP